MRKILFLDIDGVLNSEAFYARRHNIIKDPENRGNFHKEYHSLLDRKLGHYAHGIDEIDPEAVALVQDIVDKTGCEIVLSSSWRTGDMDDMNNRAINMILLRMGLKDPFVGVTPRLKSRIRGEECDKWLKTQPDWENIRFCIIDDDTDILDGQTDSFVNVDFMDGLTRELADKAIEILNRE